MPRGMSEDVSNVIVQALQRGLSRSQISGVVGVSKRAITRINTNLKKHGNPKAPPSGLKLGRPTRLTAEQAEAMLGWMADRDYTFYVKDLVVYLRDNYDYKGCDGTVRRGLLRAGFRRRLPWHKSEVSVWLPPEIPVDITSNSPQSNTQDARTDPVAHETTAQDAISVIANDIDPNLDRAILSPHSPVTLLPSSNPTQPQQQPHLITQHSPKSTAHRAYALTTSGSLPFSASTSQSTNLFDHIAAPSPPPQTSNAPARTSRQKQAATPRKNRKRTVSELQNETQRQQQLLLEQQNEIQRLQEQLAAHQQQQRRRRKEVVEASEITDAEAEGDESEVYAQTYTSPYGDDELEEV